MAAADFYNTVQQFYIAYYQRPADPGGLRYWAEQLDAANGDVTAILPAFANSPEALELYGEITADNIQTVINSIYNALFQRDAEPGGLDFYTAQFLTGTLSAGEIAFRILSGARNADAVAIDNKVEAANAFTATVDGRSLDDPEFGGGGISQFEVSYSGPGDSQAARGWLAGVTADPATDPTESEVIEFVYGQIADRPESRTVFTLTEQRTVTEVEDTELLTTEIYWGDPEGNSVPAAFLWGDDGIIWRYFEERGNDILGELNLASAALEGIENITLAGIQDAVGSEPQPSIWSLSVSPSSDSVDDFDETVTIDYVLDGVPGAFVIDEGAGDFSVPGALAGAVADAFDSLGTVTAQNTGGSLVTLTTDAGVPLNIVAVTSTAVGPDGTPAAIESTLVQAASSGAGNSGDDDFTGTYELTVSLDDGNTTSALVQLSEADFAYLNGLLLNEDGTSRLFERTVPQTVFLVDEAGDSDEDGIGDSLGLPVEVEELDSGESIAYAIDSNGDRIVVPAVIDGGDLITFTPPVLTTTANNGGTEEDGFTSPANDLIVAGRLELLHGAYIDAGQGFNTLEVDAKGYFAQPKELLGIQQINIQNLPNVYTTTDAAGNIVNDYPDVQESSAPSASSVLDVSRAVDLEGLTVTEGNFPGLDANSSVGSLTVAGIRNGVPVTLDGSFSGDVSLFFSSSSDPSGLNLIFNNVSMGDGESGGASLRVAQNAEVANIEVLSDSFVNGIDGGALRVINISGEGHLHVDSDLPVQSDTPVTIDASGSTGGVDLSADAENGLTFIGTEVDDRFDFDGSGDFTAILGEGDNALDVDIEDTESAQDSSGEGGDVIVTAGDGDNEVNVDLEDGYNDEPGLDNESVVSIDMGDGDNDVDVNAADYFVITLGDGDNRIDASGGEDDSSEALITGQDANFLTVGDGDNEIDATGGILVVTAGAGANEIDASGELVFVTAGDGGNLINVRAEEFDVVTGAGDDTVIISGDNPDFVSDGALFSVDVGAGSDIVVLGGGDDTEGSGVSITAHADSSITGEAVTLVVNTVSDLSRATLSGVTSVVIDDDLGADMTASLTLTAEQFTAIGAENFSVDGADFGALGTVRILVDEDTNAADLGLADMPVGLDAQIVIGDGANLSISAELLHTKITEDGIMLANDRSEDIASGTVTITGAGLDFDPFNSSDVVRTIIGGNEYNGGSLSDDFGMDMDTPANGVQRDEWGSNVSIDRGFNGYDRPTDAVTWSRLTIDTDSDGPTIGPFSTIETFLRIVGESDLSFVPVAGGIDEFGLPVEGGSAIALGVDNGAPTNPFLVDFSDATGAISNLTFSGFDNAAAVYGNGTGETPARVNVEIGGVDGIVSGDGVAPDGNPSGFVSGGVQHYVVTDLSQANDLIGTYQPLRSALDSYSTDLGAIVNTRDNSIASANNALDNAVDAAAAVYNAAWPDLSYTDAASLIAAANAVIASSPDFAQRNDAQVVVNTVNAALNANSADIASATTVANNAIASLEGSIVAAYNAYASAAGDARLPAAGSLSDVQAEDAANDIDAVFAENGAEAQFWTSRATQDLQTLGLQGNYTGILTFGNIERGVDLLMEVVYDKYDGYGVGTVVADFARSGADAVVNVVGLDTLPDGEVQQVAGIELINAETATINVTGGDTILERLADDGVEDWVFTADADLTVESSFLSDDTESLDGTGVAGDFIVRVAGDADLSDVVITGLDTLLLDGTGEPDGPTPPADSADLILSAAQVELFGANIVDADPADEDDTSLSVVELTTEALDLDAIDVDNIDTVTFADVGGTIEVAVTDFGDADTVEIDTTDNGPVAIQMTAAQWQTIDNGGRVPAEAQDIDVIGGRPATLVITDPGASEYLDFTGTEDTINLVVRITSDLTASADDVTTPATDEEMEFVDVANQASSTLEIGEAAVDLTAANAGMALGFASVAFSGAGTLTLTADQVEAIGIVDADGNGAAENWTGFAGATLNVVGLSDEVLNLDAIAGAGVNIGTVSIANTDAAITIDAGTTFGGADEIITPTALAGAPEFGTERTTVTMTVDQFRSSGGVISGDSQINLTDLYNNVDTNGNFVPDATDVDLSGIANAGTITFADDTVNPVGTTDPNDSFVTLTDAADLGGFTILLADGELIRFATEAQAAASITVVDGLNDVTGVQWLFTESTTEVDTGGYDEDITTLFIDEAILVSQPIEEDLWTDLPGSIVVQKINGTAIPELIKTDRINTFEAFTNLADGINYDDDDDFSTVAELTMNLEGEVNIGDILLGDTKNGDGSSPNIDDTGFFGALTVNSYVDLTTVGGFDPNDPDTVPGRVIASNTLGDISLNAGSVDELVDVVINTYDDADGDVTTSDGGYLDPVNVNGAEAERDGLAIEVGTITFEANEADAWAELTLTGDEDITVENVVPGENVKILEVDMYGITDNDEPTDVTIGGINWRDFDIDSDDDTDDGVALDSVIFVNGDYADDDAFVDGTLGGTELVVVLGGDVDFTEAGLNFVDALTVAGDATITLTADQVAAIEVGDFTVADDVTVTLNVTDVDAGDSIDLDTIEDAGFNIGTVTLSETTQDIRASGITFGGADEIVIETDDDNPADGVLMTAMQFASSSGVITETGDGEADVTISDLVGIATDEDDDTVDETVDIDLTGVTTSGTQAVWVSNPENAVAPGAAAYPVGADLTFTEESELADFAVTLVDVDSTAVANDLAGETIRFATAVQAERTVNVVGGETTDAEQDTNVVWLFNSITGTETDGKVDTADYDDALGRVWMLESLVSDQNVEELFTSLDEGIIIRVVNEDDLDALNLTQGFDRKVEIESYTTIGDLTFEDIDESGRPLDFVENLTIDFGGDVEMGAIIVSNVLADPIDNDDEFDTLFLNSFLATGAPSGAEYLLPEGFDYGNQAGEVPFPTLPNQVGDIASGSDAFDLGHVVIDTASPDGITINGFIIDGTVTFSDDGDGLVDQGTGAKSDPATTVATFTVDNDGDVRVGAFNTDDADITGLVITKDGGDLDVVGTSAGLQANNTEGVTLATGGDGGSTTFGTEGDADRPGVAGDELSNLVVTGDDDVDYGVIALIDSDDDDDGEGTITDAFTLDASTATGQVTAILGEGNVGGTATAPTLEAESTWNFIGNNAGGSNLDLTITEDVTLEADSNLVFTDVDLTIQGDVDITEVNVTVNVNSTLTVPEGAALRLTAEQADGVTITGGGSVIVEALEETPDAELGGIFTSDGDTGDVTANVDTSDGDDDDTDPDTVDLSGSLGRANVVISGDGEVTVSGSLDTAAFDGDDDTDTADQVEATTFTVGEDATLTLTGAQTVVATLDDDGTTPAPSSRPVDGDGTTIVTISLATTADAGALLDNVASATTEARVSGSANPFTGSFGAVPVTLMSDTTNLAADITILDGVDIDYDQSDVDDPADAATVTVTSDAADQDEADATGGDLSGITARNIVFVPGDLFGTLTFPELDTDTIEDSSNNDIDYPQSVTLTSEQASGQTIEGEGNVTVNAVTGGTVDWDFSDITPDDPEDDDPADNLSLVFASTPPGTTTTLSDTSDLGDMEVELSAFDTLVATGAQVSGLIVSGAGTLQLTEVGAGDDLTGVDPAVTVTATVDGDVDLSDVDGLNAIDVDPAADPNPTLTIGADQFGALSAGDVAFGDEIDNLDEIVVDVAYTPSGGSPADVDLTVSDDDPANPGGGWSVTGPAAGIVQAQVDDDADSVAAGLFGGSVLTLANTVTHTGIGTIVSADSGADGFGGVEDIFEVVAAAQLSSFETAITTFSGGGGDGDKLDVTAFGDSDGTPTDAAGATFTTTADEVYFLSQGGGIDTASAAAVATAVNTAATITDADATAYIVIADTASGTSALYEWTDTAASGDEVGAGELQLIATLDAALVVTDILA